MVIDNDKLQATRKTIDDFVSKHNMIRIVYEVEERQNIALARNKAISYAKGDFIAFIDDDEQPSNDWLYRLYNCIKKYKSDCVLGPVLPCFEISPPKWIIKGKLIDRLRFKAGSVLIWKDTRTGNVLIKKEAAGRNSDLFKEKFGSGDRDFFNIKIEGGFQFRWCNKAIVFEHINKKRLNISVLIKRALLRGKASLASSTQLSKSILISITATVFYGLTNSFLFLFSALIESHVLTKYLIAIFDHLGKLLAFLKIYPNKENFILI